MNVHVVVLRHLLYALILTYVQYFDYRSFITINNIAIIFMIDSVIAFVLLIPFSSQSN